MLWQWLHNLTFARRCTGWRSHSLNESEQITDEGILQWTQEKQDAETDQQTRSVNSYLKSLHGCWTYREFGSILEQKGLESIKGRLFFSEVDDKFGCETTKQQVASEQGHQQLTDVDRNPLPHENNKTEEATTVATLKCYYKPTEVVSVMIWVVTVRKVV